MIRDVNLERRHSLDRNQPAGYAFFCLESSFLNNNIIIYMITTLLIMDFTFKQMAREYKWQNQLLDDKGLKNLAEKSRLFPQENKFFMLFLKTGFTANLMDASISSISQECSLSLPCQVSVLIKPQPVPGQFPLSG